MKSSSPKTKIYVMSGEYTNLGYGEGLDNGALMTIKELEYLLCWIVRLSLQDTHDILLTNFARKLLSSMTLI